MIPWWCNVQSMTHMWFGVNTMHDAMCSQGSGTHTWNLQYINPFLVLKIWYFNYDGAMCNNDIIGAKWCIRKSDYGCPEILGYNYCKSRRFNDLCISTVLSLIGRIWTRCTQNSRARAKRAHAGIKWMPLCTEKQARASKYINPLMPPAAIHTVRTLCLFKKVCVYDK